MEDRDRNLDRAVYIAKILSRNGAIVLCSFISPIETQRRKIASELANYGNFIQVYVKASIDLCKERDDEGIYKMAEEGRIENFTGVSSPYEEPDSPDMIVDTSRPFPNVLMKPQIIYSRHFNRLSNFQTAQLNED